MLVILIKRVPAEDGGGGGLLGGAAEAVGVYDTTEALPQAGGAGAGAKGTAAFAQVQVAVEPVTAEARVPTTGRVASSAVAAASA